MAKTLKELCEAIEAGYAADKSMLDDDMIELVQELADRTGEIKRLIARQQADNEEITKHHNLRGDDSIR